MLQAAAPSIRQQLLAGGASDVRRAAVLVEDDADDEVSAFVNSSPVSRVYSNDSLAALYAQDTRLAPRSLALPAARKRSAEMTATGQPATKQRRTEAEAVPTPDRTADAEREEELEQRKAARKRFEDNSARQRTLYKEAQERTKEMSRVVGGLPKSAPMTTRGAKTSSTASARQVSHHYSLPASQAHAVQATAVQATDTAKRGASGRDRAARDPPAAARRAGQDQEQDDTTA